MINSQAVFTIAADHPALPGHFPGRPVVPGVLILGHVLAAFEAAHGSGTLRAIPEVKFVAPLAPGEPCAVTFDGLASGETRFECTAGGRVVARGRLQFTSGRYDGRGTC